MRTAAAVALLLLAGACAPTTGDDATRARFRDCPDCPAMVRIPPGAFELGRADGRAAEAPPRRVAIARPFAIAETEITFAQYDRCVATGGCPERPWDRDWGRGDRPVIYVSWRDATAYADWLAETTGAPYRLPTEAEWEYAALGGDPAPATGRRRANCDGCTEKWTHRTWPVREAPVNGYGLYGMLGNVTEWTADCWRPSHAPDAAADCDRRTRKGGSWYFDEYVAVPSYRAPGRPGHEGYDIGFRVARPLPE